MKFHHREIDNIITTYHLESTTEELALIRSCLKCAVRKCLKCADYYNGKDRGENYLQIESLIENIDAILATYEDDMSLSREFLEWYERKQYRAMQEEENNENDI